MFAETLQGALQRIRLVVGFEALPFAPDKGQKIAVLFEQNPADFAPDEFPRDVPVEFLGIGHEAGGERRLALHGEALLDGWGGHFGPKDIDLVRVFEVLGDSLEVKRPRRHGGLLRRLVRQLASLLWNLFLRNLALDLGDEAGIVAGGFEVGYLVTDGADVDAWDVMQEATEDGLTNAFFAQQAFAEGWYVEAAQKFLITPGEYCLGDIAQRASDSPRQGRAAHAALGGVLPGVHAHHGGIVQVLGHKDVRRRNPCL
jgi:hypothetical protein